jgi:hypothetical protein
MIRFSLAIALLVSALHGSSAEEPPLSAAFDEGGVLIRQGNQPVLYYQRATKSLEGAWPRAAYVHPLYDLRGNVISEDFPGDHLHHRGIFWAWHQVWVGDQRLGDPWTCKDFVWEVESVQCSSPASPLVLEASVLWKSPLHVDEAGTMIPLVRERVGITVHAAEDSYRLIDFDIALQAIVDGVRIGGSEDDKGYGGFSPRIRLSADQRFTSAGGEVEPGILAIEAGPWINIAGAEYGLAVIAHDANPRPAGAEDVAAPQRWILRRQRSMQNAVYPGRDPVELSTELPTRLRYRIAVHDGTLEGEQIESIQQDYLASAR